MRNKEELFWENVDEKMSIDMINFEFESDLGPEQYDPEVFSGMDLEFDL